LRVNRSFNAHYIFQFVCVPFAGRRRQPIAVERYFFASTND